MFGVGASLVHAQTAPQLSTSASSIAQSDALDPSEPAEAGAEGASSTPDTDNVQLEEGGNSVDSTN